MTGVGIETTRRRGFTHSMWRIYGQYYSVWHRWHCFSGIQYHCEGTGKDVDENLLYDFPRYSLGLSGIPNINTWYYYLELSGLRISGKNLACT
jgi:hypothetical protein